MSQRVLKSIDYSVTCITAVEQPAHLSTFLNAEYIAAAVLFFFKFHQRQIAWLVRSSADCYSKLKANSITLSAVLEERCQKKKKIYRRGLLFEYRLLHPYTQGTKASVEEVYFFYRHARPPWPPPKNDAWSSLIVGCRAFQLVRLFWKTKAKPLIAHAQNLNDVVIIFS